VGGIVGYLGLLWPGGCLELLHVRRLVLWRDLGIVGMRRGIMSLGRRLRRLALMGRVRMRRLVVDRNGSRMMLMRLVLLRMLLMLGMVRRRRQALCRVGVMLEAMCVSKSRLVR
jgi:hypothetical protein